MYPLSRADTRLISVSIIIDIQSSNKSEKHHVGTALSEFRVGPFVIPLTPEHVYNCKKKKKAEAKLS